VAPCHAEDSAQAKDAYQADALVVASPEVMGGVAVFAGTRVPIDIVLGSVAEGVDAQRLRASYPFLTDAHLQAAREYEAVHPRRGRSRYQGDVDPPGVSGTTRRVVRDAK
jgi:uncharacterized protein (DUF433 family)